MSEQADNRILDTILSRGLRAGAVVADEFRRQVLKLAKRGLSPLDILTQTRRLLMRYEPLFSRTLSDTLLASWIAGATEIPRESSYPIANQIAPPPDVPDDPVASASSGEPVVRFPVIEKDARDLLSRRVMLKSEFESLAQDAKRAAFTVSRIASLETLSDIRDILGKDVREGGTLRAFRKQLGDVLDGTPLSKSHVENVYRTNTMQAYSAGLMDTLQDDLVRDEFPYLLYSATHDARARPDHLAMEHLGLDGTAVYRVDDPVMKDYLPPWDFSCRCTVIPLSVEDAAAYGVKEAQEWLRTGQPPRYPQFVKPPLFRPSEGWMRRRFAA